jgi:hypothetical protein
MREASGSNPARSTFTPARPLFESPQTLEVILDLKKQGKAEETINGYSRRLRHLAKNTDINNPETGETEKIGDDFIELWKEIQKKQHNLPTYVGSTCPLYG